MKRSSARHGYALIVVLGLMVLLALYLGAAQTSVSFMAQSAKIHHARQAMINAIQSAVSIVLTTHQPAPGSTATLTLPDDVTLQATLQPLGAQDPVWRQARGLEPKNGDCLLSLEAPDGGPMVVPHRFIVNTNGLRAGLITLSVHAPSVSKHEATKPADNTGAPTS